MSLDDLYQRVSAAILNADRLEDEGASRTKVRFAKLSVSFLEQEIAELLPASDPEGAIARRGAVRAALEAGVHARVRELVESYLDEADAELAAELNALVAQADDELPARDVRVVPAATYQIHAA